MRHACMPAACTRSICIHPGCRPVPAGALAGELGVDLAKAVDMADSFRRCLPGVDTWLKEVSTQGWAVSGISTFCIPMLMYQQSIHTTRPL